MNVPATARRAAQAIAQSAREDLQRAILPALAAGTAVATWAFAEQRQPWSQDGLATTATEIPEGFRLRGVKTAVQDAETARWIVVTAQLDGHSAQFILDRQAEGLQRAPRAQHRRHSPHR